MSREILSPPLIHIRNHCYRVNLVHEDFGGSPLNSRDEENHETTLQTYVEEDMYNEEDEPTEDSDCPELERVNSEFILKLQVASSLFGGIVGPMGSTKRRIQAQTKTVIAVPFIVGVATEKQSCITIKGKSAKSVISARDKIIELTKSLRQHIRPTHFVGILLNHSEIAKNFTVFKKQVLSASLPGISESVFQTENCLHLTIGTCVLLNEQERAKANVIVQTSGEILCNLKTPLEVKIQGLDIMNDDPGAVNVLFARVKAPELQIFANRLQNCFVHNGLAKQNADSNDIKLHMTLMNAKYKKNVDAGQSTPFDARELIKRWSDFDFGVAHISEVGLFILQQKDENGNYKMTKSFKF